jgi:carbon-monoxide dehydrogenase large subunit
MSAATHAGHAPFNPRIEDDALLRGRGRFADDLTEPGQAVAAFVRAPHAFANILAVDTEAALGVPGVLAVLTSADMDAAGVGNMSRPVPLSGRGGVPQVVPHRPALAGTRVLHVGDAVAMVVAETLAAAQEAAELVAVDYEELAPVVDVRDAAARGAPQLWPEAPGNLAVDWSAVNDDGTNEREVARIIAEAPHVARVSLVNQRLVVASMEPRGATASYDAATGHYTLRCGSQGAAAVREQLFPALGVEREQLRVLTDDVGGGFGMKTPSYPEYAALLVAARKLGRPVHWMSTRSEAFVSDNQGRDTVTDAELALDADGRFLALRVRVMANLGGYLGSHGAFISTSNFARCLSSMYRIPRIDAGCRCYFTNTVPIGPYRGAGRPEANYAIERIIEAASRLTGIDSVALRRRNLIPPELMPYATPVGTVYDSGEFSALLDKALSRADYAGFPARRERSAAQGRLRGIGVSCFLEHAGGMPTEGAAIAFTADRKVTLALGAQATGQGHATIFGRLTADRLGIPATQVNVREGDSRLEIASAGTVASRGTMTAGNAAVRAIETVIEKGRAVAAQMLEAAEADIDYGGGVFEVTGTDRRLSLFDVAERAAELGTSLDTKLTADTPQTFPNGCHIAEVEIDPDTGVVTILRYTAVDDCGVALDPVLVEGQVQGALAQGVGQALLETAIYDRASGQLLTGSFMDYTMPRADDVPDAVGEMHNVPATTNALGVKGVGEAGTTGSIAAIMNAIANALPGDAGATLDMPATPNRVWLACQGRTPNG